MLKFLFMVNMKLLHAVLFEVASNDMLRLWLIDLPWVHRSDIWLRAVFQM